MTSTTGQNPMEVLPSDTLDLKRVEMFHKDRWIWIWIPTLLYQDWEKAVCPNTENPTHAPHSGRWDSDKLRQGQYSVSDRQLPFSVTHRSIETPWPINLTHKTKMLVLVYLQPFKDTRVNSSLAISYHYRKMASQKLWHWRNTMYVRY